MKTQKGYKKRGPVDIIDVAGNNRTVSHRIGRLNSIARSCADGNEIRRDHRKNQLERRELGRGGWPFTISGETKTLGEWSEFLNLSVPEIMSKARRDVNALIVAARLAKYPFLPTQEKIDAQKAA